MKKILSSLLCLLLGIGLFAQTDTTGVYVGVNAAKMLQMMSPQSNSNLINPYLVELGYGGSKFGFHASLGLDKSTSTHQPSSANGNVTTQVDSSHTDWRIGAYYKLAIHARWNMHFGIDYYQSGYTQSLSTEFQNEDGAQVKNDNSSIFKESGISPYLRLDYKPHPKVSIGTELLFRIGKDNLTEKAESNLFPEFDSELITEGNRTYFIAPSALFICLTL
jgi:hypothetical protein